MTQPNLSSTSIIQYLVRGHNFPCWKTTDNSFTELHKIIFVHKNYSAHLIFDMADMQKSWKEVLYLTCMTWHDNLWLRVWLNNQKFGWNKKTLSCISFAVLSINYCPCIIRHLHKQAWMHKNTYIIDEWKTFSPN